MVCRSFVHALLSSMNVFEALSSSAGSSLMEVASEALHSMKHVVSNHDFLRPSTHVKQEPTEHTAAVVGTSETLPGVVPGSNLQGPTSQNRKVIGTKTFKGKGKDAKPFAKRKRRAYVHKVGEPIQMAVGGTLLKFAINPVRTSGLTFRVGRGGKPTREVLQVQAGSPEAKAGVRVGDMVMCASQNEGSDMKKLEEYHVAARQGITRKRHFLIIWRGQGMLPKELDELCQIAENLKPDAWHGIGSQKFPSQGELVPFVLQQKNGSPKSHISSSPDVH